VSIDETADVDDRYVANVVIDTLFAEHPAEVFLIVSEVLDRANHSTITVLFDNAMKLLWPDEVRQENILLFLIDALCIWLKRPIALRCCTLRWFM
jgi:hypothetical protein